MGEINISRRALIKRSAFTVGALIVGKHLLTQSTALAETPPAKVFKLIDPEKNVTAKSLKFSHEGAKNPARKLDYAVCGNCQMYRKKGEADGVEVGTCNMIGGGYVKVTGWCTSWVREPKAFKK